MKYTTIGTGDFSRIRYIEVDHMDKSTNTIFGIALDFELRVLGRVKATGTSNEYNEIASLKRKGCNVLDVCNPKYGNIVLIDSNK
jgi:hypothetical protein